jgi:hypothetical protein
LTDFWSIGMTLKNQKDTKNQTVTLKNQNDTLKNQNDTEE